MINLFKQNRLRKYLYFCLFPLYYLFGLLRGIGFIPRKYIIYGAAGGSKFIDNSKYSFLLNKDEYNCVWITHSSSLARELRLKGYRAYFCINCGVYLYCKYSVAVGRIAVRTATLNNLITPQAHIFIKDKDPWIDIKNKEICFDTMYDRDKFWPEESLKRLEEKNKK